MTALKPVLKNQLGRHPDWQLVYRPESYRELPWYSQHLDPNLQDFFSKSHFDRIETILDVGTGDGTQAWELALRGFKVTGIDIATDAITLCNRFSTENLKFLVADVLVFESEEIFDCVIDRGCMHVLSPSSLEEYCRNVFKLLRPGGKLLLSCFMDRASDQGMGPHRFDRECLDRIFFDTFRILYTSTDELSGPRTQKPKTLFSVLERL